MKFFAPFCAGNFSRALILLTAAVTLAANTTRAGLTFTVDLYVNGGTYVFYTPVNTNAIAPAAPLGIYTIFSPGQPTNGSWRQFSYDTNGFNTIGGSENSYSDLPSALQQITNGNWTIQFTNATVTNYYTFKVSLPSGLTTNQLPATLITSPAGGANNLINMPTFLWQGQPTNWPVSGSLYVYQYNNNNSSYFYYPPGNVSSSQTNWTIPMAIPASNPNSYTYFNINYVTNYTGNLFIATPPLNTNNAQPIAGWAYTSTLESGASVGFTVAAPPSTSVSHTLVAHYTFDNNGDLGFDSSTNGNSLECAGCMGDCTMFQFTANAEAGGGAVQFFGQSWMNLCDAPTSWTNTLFGSFTVSAWINTTNVLGKDTDPLNDGDGQEVIYLNNNGNGVIPLGITGTKAAIATGVPPGAYGQDTLNSVATTTSGSYVHVVVTRDQGSGLKQIYINGVLDSSDYGEPGILDGGTDWASIGGQGGAPFTGKLDDVQIYSGVLSGSEIAYLDANPGNTVINGAVNNGGHLIVARYNFEDTNSPGTDSSGQGNDSNCGGGDGTTNHPDIFSTAAAVGSYSRDFLGHSFVCFTPDAQSFFNLSNALSGSFSVSAWVKTTQSLNDDNANADAGANILFAEAANTNSTVPLAITGSKAAFSVNDHNGTVTTVHSLTSVNDGQYHQLAVTRNQASGQLKIYVDGNLEGSASGTTDPLYINSIIAMGGYLNLYNGLLDDVQIYSGVLNDADVAGLFASPGSTVPDVSGQDFDAVLGTTNLNWASSGDISWFVETTNTYNGSPAAAQSGSVIDSQSSMLSTTVTGPGTLTFYWASIAEDPNQGFNYEFVIDGVWADNISGDTSWQPPQNGPFTIPAGTHTLSWTVTANGDTDPTQAGFLDQVSYVQDMAPTITLNPFNQTNYPGYNVALLAAVATNTTVTWQWFKVGSASPIPNATSALFIPTNSGTAGVAGSYYAVVSTAIGSANTTTAAVSFVSAPLPPDWSVAFKSPFRPMDDTTVTKDYYYGCITDTNGNIYAAAVFDGNMMMTNGITNLDSGTGGDAAAVVKQSSTGAPLWAVAITNNGNGSAQAYCVAPAPGGGVYVSGDYSGTNWLGTNRLTDAGNGDIFLARFDANGSNLWVKTFGSTNTDFVVLNTLTADPAGNVTLSGLLGSGPVSIGSSNYTVIGQQGAIVQFDQTGAIRWSQLTGFAQYLTWSSGRLYVSLNTTTSGGTTNVVIGGSSNVTDRAWAIACLNGTNGQAIWVRGVGAKCGSSSGNPYAGGIVDDPPRLAVSGTNVFLTGVAYDSTASFGTLTVNFGDLRGQYFVRYDTNGNAQVATTYGSVTTTPFAAVADAKGDLYVSGDFDTYSIFGNDIIATPIATRPFNALYFSQAFLAKFDLNGNPLWAREAVVSLYGTVNFGGIALASDGVWASGWGLCGYYPATVSVIFGTNTVNSDVQYVSGGAGGSENAIFYPGGMLAKVTDSVAAASPVLLLNPSNNGANFQFQFLSESGFNHNILYRTNLAAGTWRTNSTVSGDGTIKVISLPYSIFSPSKQGFIRVSTQ